jgi:hypothetical protein
VVVAKKNKKWQKQKLEETLYYPGLEPLIITPIAYLLILEEQPVTGSRKFLRLIKGRNTKKH